MKNAAIIFLFALVSAHPAESQTEPLPDKYLNRIPPNLKLIEQTPQRYRVITDYFNFDIYGNFMNKIRVTGAYTRGNPDGMVKWNQVQIGSATARDGSFHDWSPQDYMEGFTYSPKSNLMDASAFPNFPAASFQAKNLVWDMLMLEIVSWAYLDSLKLNEPYRPNINGEVQLAGEGTFENKDFRITWTGLSKMNGEPCLLIEYQAFDNPLTVDTEQVNIHGRSHYWGNVWVSLTDKQIEHATLHEDVVMKMSFSGQEGAQLLDTRREIVVEKLDK